MRHILLHYPAIPPVPASFSKKIKGDDHDDPFMLDISLGSVTLRLPGPSSSSSTVHSVAFDPPLVDWAERRARLVEMTRSARAALGISEEGKGEEVAVAAVVVDEYMPPRVPSDVGIMVGVLLYSACFGLLCAGLAGQGTVVGRAVEAVRFPGGVEGFSWFVRDVLFWPTLVVHSAETWWLERSRLRRYGVKRGSRVWWLWMGSVFLEGFMAFKRFDIIVRRLQAEAKKRQ
ncbi:hypothetical protein N658DRAFT_495937 [Parathielavia hyrcaniae]|uniref:DUF2470 domain-containing protein n=1 Tax=Parathielavia hyrcaniae TaxID=113614 RepID=A0AAN6Q582_9PEZI|nr:hypothetical protein N658DRAFT_495937 [Parathielavia hyrcaniae]